MEERKTIFDYLAGVLIIFGFTIIALNVFCKAFGEEAIAVSSIFQLGSKGLATSTMVEFLAVSFIIMGIRYLFFTDCLIKKMSVTLRTVCMVTLVIITIGIFSYAFSWFPVTQWQAWAMFFVCFAVCFLVSFLVTLLKEKAENKQLESALRKLQEMQNAECN